MSFYKNISGTLSKIDRDVFSYLMRNINYKSILGIFVLCGHADSQMFVFFMQLQLPEKDKIVF